MAHLLPEFRYERLGNTDVPSGLLPPWGPALSDSSSCESFKSPVGLLHLSPTPESNGGTDSLAFTMPAKPSCSPQYGSSESITPSPTLGAHYNSDQRSVSLLQFDEDQHSPPSLTLPNSSFYSFESVPDKLKSRRDVSINERETLDQLPTPTILFDSIYKPTVDKGLLEPEHPPALDGYVEAHSLPELAMSPGPNSHQEFKIPIFSDHFSPHPPLIDAPIWSSESDSGSFTTALESFESNLGNSSEAASISSMSSSGYPKPANKRSGNISEPPLPLMSNGNIDKRRPTMLELSSLTLMDGAPPSLLQPKQPILAKSKAYASEPQSPLHSATFFVPHPRTPQQPPLREPFHDGSLLTPAINAAVSEAAALYEATRQNGVSKLPGLMVKPFSIFSPETLACQYATTVDAKNALVLRQSAIVADIGLFLELLIPKVNVYATDTVMLTSIQQDLELLRQECIARHIDLPFNDLEWGRSPDHPCGLAFTNEGRHQNFSWQDKTMDVSEYSDARAVGLQFVNDPASIIDNRLPTLRLQR